MCPISKRKVLTSRNLLSCLGMEKLKGTLGGGHAGGKRTEGGRLAGCQLNDVNRKKGRGPPCCLLISLSVRNFTPVSKK